MLESLSRLLNFELIHYKDHSLTVFEIVSVVLIFFITRFLLWFIRKALLRYSKVHKLDEGTSFALYQLIKYMLWVIAVALMIEAVGGSVTFLLAGSAALLVGLGMGLQQTFNDFLSGIILLFEHSVKVGDILEIDGEIVKIQEIGLRTSKGMTRRQIVVILPNSLITTNKVINWSHQQEKTLFTIDVGVAYGSDIDKVAGILEASAASHPDIDKKDVLPVRFINFGDSSLDFQVLFFSEDIFNIEKIKSDIRKIIYKKFEENGISIPFPQLDLHLKSK